ncbi:hypothetical protein D3C85_1408360 [compost metagenome]
MHGTGIGLAHHVEVALQHHADTVFHARRRRLAHDQVAGLVDHRLQTAQFRPAFQIVAQRRFMFGRTRNVTQGLKVFPHDGGFEGCNIHHNKALLYSAGGDISCQ